LAQKGYWQGIQTARASRRRFIGGAAAGGAGLALLAACGGGSSGGSPAPSSGGAEGPLASSQVLKVRYYDDPGGFDPANLFRIEVENIAFNVYSGLTTYEPEHGKLIPDLAESWETPDATTYNFKLVKNAKFHKGFGDFSAQDVLYSYNRILDPATAATYRAEFNNVDAISAPDPYTVQIKLKRPDANFLHQVANYHQGQVVSRAAIEKFGPDYKFNPIGTGPFVFESFTPAQQIVLARHPDYFRAPATLEKISFRIIKDDQTASIALQNGEVDLAMRIGDDQPLRQVMADGRFTMNALSGYAVSLTIFNLENQYLKDARVRQAYARAIDYEAVVKATSPLTTKTWYNLIPDWMDVFTPDVAKYPYDEAKARSLLAAAGYASGFNLKQPTTAVSDSTQLIQSYLNKVGIKPEFTIMDTPTYNGVRTRGEFDISGRLTPAINPDTIFFSYLHPDNIAPKGLNGARYNNPEVTQLLEAARAEQDFERRKGLYAQVQKIAIADLPYWPTTNSAVFWPGYKWVTGVKINPLAQTGFYDVKVLAHG
jgi:peptide/nickel transport system substrate-binding protein